MSFNYEGHYICICGREFTNSQSFNAHKSHCRLVLGEEKYNTRLEQVLSSGLKGVSAYSRNCEVKKQKELEEWVSEKHTCEHCGKIMTEKYGSGRFCSRKCANSRNLSEEVKLNISKGVLNQNLHEIRVENYNSNPRLCANCGAPLSWERRWNSTCSQECANKINQEKAVLRADTIIHNNCLSGYCDGIYMASSSELMYWKWCKDQSINIIRNKNTFKYIDENNIERMYIPDFYLVDENKYIEIKGKGFWYNEDQVNRKLESVKLAGENIEILYDNDFGWLDKYFKDKYGLKTRQQICEEFYN